MRPERVTSLWNLVESMQRQFEAEGLENEVVDVAVTRGLLNLLSGPARRAEKESARRLLLSNLRLLQPANS